jgi:hypothetical protein
MKTIAVITLILGLASRTEAAPEPQQSSRCISVPPICAPGQAPVCFCESQYSYNCMWICGSTR